VRPPGSEFLVGPLVARRARQSGPMPWSQPRCSAAVSRERCGTVRFFVSLRRADSAGRRTPETARALTTTLLCYEGVRAALNDAAPTELRDAGALASISTKATTVLAIVPDHRDALGSPGISSELRFDASFRWMTRPPASCAAGLARSTRTAVKSADLVQS